MFVWVYGGGLQLWATKLLSTIGRLSLIAAIVLPLFLAIAWGWWNFGPGATERRKAARRQLRGQLGVIRIQEVGENPKKSAPPQKPQYNYLATDREGLLL